jgi:hypothetical protein
LFGVIYEFSWGEVVVFEISVDDSGSFLCGGYAVAGEVLIPSVELWVLLNKLFPT